MNTLYAALRATQIGLAAALLLPAVGQETDWTPAEAHARSDVHFSNDDRDGEPELAQLWSLLDRDGDGSVAPYEGAEALLWLTEEAGVDSEGLDLRGLRALLAEEREGELEERLEVFATLDGNADGVLDAGEVPEELDGILEQADQNEDGRLSEAELLAAGDLGDPSLMFEQELLQFLKDVDPDGDGAFALADLPPSERAGFEAEFRDLDVDGNDLVTEEELFALLEEELRQATFTIHGSRAVMDGVIGPSTPGRVLQLLLEHPEVGTIVMQNVPGSMDDESNLRAARYVRRHGLDTFLPADAEIASGGTDFFLAGVRRTALPGARIGIHSWSGFDEEGADLSRDHPEHAKYLTFYRDMGIPAEFYWRTLEAAPADDIHWMTREEIERFEVEAHPVSTTKQE